MFVHRMILFIGEKPTTALEQAKDMSFVTLRLVKFCAQVINFESDFIPTTVMTIERVTILKCARQEKKFFKQLLCAAELSRNANLTMLCD